MRKALPVRPDWQLQAEAYGFGFHTIDSLPYWDESAAWQFSLAEIEHDLEKPTTELHALCLAAAAEIVNSEYWLTRFAIPSFAHDLVLDSWRQEQQHPGHPNLLPCYFADDPKASLTGFWVWKPLFSREGANISWLSNGQATETTPGPYGQEGAVVQAAHPLPSHQGQHMLMGSWVVGDQACGLSIREDRSRITQDSSRFLPHYILD